MTPGAAIRFGVPFSEYDTVFFGIGAERTEIQRRDPAAEQLVSLSRAVRRPEQLGPADDRLDARQPRQRPGAHGRPLHARQRRLRADRRRPATSAPISRASSTSSSRARSASASTPRSATARAWAAGPTRSSRTSTAVASARCAASSRASLGPVDVTGAFIGGNRRFNINNELYLPVPGANATTGRCASSCTSTPATSGARTRRSRSTACARRPEPGVSWISPVGPLKLSYGAPIQKKPEDRIQKLQFQIGTAF